MSTAFQLPEWLPVAEPPPSPPVDDHRVEALVNRFIAGKQEALFTAPDAFYRRSGADALDGAPATVQRLKELKAATLEQARDDGERAALAPRLDLHIGDANDGIDRHVAEQRLLHQRQILSDRQALILRAAELEHDNDDKIAGLAEANGSAAQETARMDGRTERPAMDEARSAVWCTVIGQRIAAGKAALAIGLFDRVRDRLAPADLLSLDTPVQAARFDQAADQWIAGQTGTDGPPLQERVDADPDLTPEAKAIVRAKVDARDAATESARAAQIQELDDEARAAMHARAVNPRAYRPGTFAKLADAYDAAGDREKAASARRWASYDAFIVPFARASAERQQQMIDELPESELRDAAITVRDHQAGAFEAFTPGSQKRLRPSATDILRPVLGESGDAKLRSDDSNAPVSLPPTEVDVSRPTERGKEEAPQIADDRKTYCLDRCSNLILMRPFSRRPATFDECFAHCEGRMYFKHMQPFIPFPNQ
jgi:hypothetical protein